MFEVGSKIEANSDYAYKIEKILGIGAFGIVYQASRISHNISNANQTKSNEYNLSEFNSFLFSN